MESKYKIEEIIEKYVNNNDISNINELTKTSVEFLKKIQPSDSIKVVYRIIPVSKKYFLK